MSFYGSHPTFGGRRVASSARVFAGLPPCRMCGYFDRVFGTLHECSRCTGAKRVIDRGCLIAPGKETQ
jgi:hypothetical protein